VNLAGLQQQAKAQHALQSTHKGNNYPLNIKYNFQKRKGCCRFAKDVALSKFTPSYLMGEGKGGGGL